MNVDEWHEVGRRGIVRKLPSQHSGQHPSDGGLPEGQIFRAAGPSAGGWTIVASHDSQESWERFRDGILVPDGGGYRRRLLRHRPAWL